MIRMEEGVSEDVSYDYGCSNTKESHRQKPTGKVT